MRILSTLFAFVVLTSLVGCGGSDPVAPAKVSSDEERQLQQDQKNVESQEGPQQAKQGRPSRR